MMDVLLPIAEKVAAALIASKATIAVAESSTGGLMSAALLAVPGASAYFLGGAVVYTRQSRRLLLDIPDSALEATATAMPRAIVVLRSRAASSARSRSRPEAPTGRPTCAPSRQRG